MRKEAGEKTSVEEKVIKVDFNKKRPKAGTSVHPGRKQ
jgi:hypothetical protein